MIKASQVPMSIDGVRLKSLIEYEEEIIKAEKLSKEFKSDKYDEYEANIEKYRYKGALYAAASKNVKRKIVICWLHNIVFKKKLILRRVSRVIL